MSALKQKLATTLIKIWPRLLLLSRLESSVTTKLQFSRGFCVPQSEKRFLLSTSQQIFTTGCITLWNWGFSVDLLDLWMIVAGNQQERVIRCFEDNILGDEWTFPFMKRWELSHCLVSNIRRKDLQGTAGGILQWYRARVEGCIIWKCLELWRNESLGWRWD